MTDERSLATGAAAPPQRGILPRGLGRSYGDAAQNAGGVVLDMTDLRRIHSFDGATGIVEADAGVSLDMLMRQVVPLGWFPHVTPGTRHVTLGGALAANVHGKNHHVDGSWVEGVRSFELVTPPRRMGGTPTSHTVTRESDPDAFWATAGGLGLTGIISRMTLQLVPTPTSFLSVDEESASNLDDALDVLERGDEHHRFSVAWVDCLARGRQLGRSVVSLANWARPEQLPRRLRDDPHAFDPVVRAAVPPVALPRLLTPTSMRAFNALWYRRAPRHRLEHVQAIAPFFHPLDAVAGWNRLYGPRGFIQYQFVVPFGAEEALRTIIATAAERRLGFLGVLKRFGAGDPGHLSFPRTGWTLAVDIPRAVDGLRRTVAHFDDLVAAAGGRVYLAKDAALTPELLPMMYPRLDDWRRIRDRLDPGHHMHSDLDRRLDLCGRLA